MYPCDEMIVRDVRDARAHDGAARCSAFEPCAREIRRVSAEAVALDEDVDLATALGVAMAHTWGWSLGGGLA